MTRLLAISILVATLLAPGASAWAEEDSTWDQYFAGETTAADVAEPSEAKPELPGSSIKWGRWLVANMLLLAMLTVAFWATKKGKLLGWLKGVRRSSKKAGKLAVVESTALANGQSIHLVEADGQRLLVGSWQGGMVSLGQLPEATATKTGTKAVVPMVADVVIEEPERPAPASVPPENADDLLPRELNEEFTNSGMFRLAESSEPFEEPDHQELADRVLEQVRRVKESRGIKMLLLFLGAALLVAPGMALAQEQAPTLVGLLTPSDDPSWMGTAMTALGILTVAALAPSLLITLTSFTRLIIVFAFLRQAMGTQNSPPNQVMIGLALFLTFFIMAPVFNEMKTNAFDPYKAGDITLDEALERGAPPLRDFMFRQTRMKDLELMVQYSTTPRPESRQDVPFIVLVPAFMLSELRTAFEIGFLIYVPFLLVDLIVSTVLLAMGMMVLPPVVISLPFKILVFVLVDGWNLLVASLLQGFG